MDTRDGEFRRHYSIKVTSGSWYLPDDHGQRRREGLGPNWIDRVAEKAVKNAALGLLTVNPFKCMI